MNLPRASGILLHPTSFPGPDGIGDLGPEAYQWIDFLKDSGTTLWQVLPLGPTGYGDSPYQCFSAFAGNTYLISPTLLLDQGLLTRADFTDRPVFPAEGVDYGNAIQWKLTLLNRAFTRFTTRQDDELQNRFNQFCKENTAWLQDYAIFMAIKESQGGRSWLEWDKALKMHELAAVQLFTDSNMQAIQEQQFKQFLFFEQWNALKEYAHANGVKIIGDVPIFVSMDSADVWAHRELFFIDSKGNPTFIAGVPPDYFSPTGQLWGNPLYNWKKHRDSGFAWWIERMRASLQLFDWIRLDHFRGFAAYWKIKAGSQTAEVGIWEKCPGAALFTALENTLGELPIIAEDLGVITPDVVALREKFSFPGMCILQFAFGGDPADRFLPHNYVRNSVVYTGTHDNNTTLGWFNTSSSAERDFCLKYLGSGEEDIVANMIRTIWSSVASFSIAPMQDFLNLDTHARMNYPSKADGNWCWRMAPNAESVELAGRIRDLNFLYSR